jgi:Ribonuclease G/E
MKGRVVLLDEIAGRHAAALMVAGRLEDLLIDPPQDAAPGVGAISLAKADRPMKGQGGLTLRLGDGLTGYLRRARDIAPGEVFRVQVSGIAEPGKAIPVTPDLIFKSRYAIVTPFAPGLNVSRAIRDDEERDRLLQIAHDSRAADDNYGLIIRSSAEGVDERAIQDDIHAMCASASHVLETSEGEPEWLLGEDNAHSLAWRDWSTPDPDEVVDTPGCFETHGVLDAVEGVLATHQSLPGGGSAFVEPTRALVAIDVNTGSDHSLAAGLKANLALVRDLPRLLRIKGLGGQITLDLAPMPKRDRKQVEDAVKKAFRKDGSDVVVAGWTPLGMLELTRKRDRRPLASIWPR